MYSASPHLFWAESRDRRHPCQAGRSDVSIADIGRHRWDRQNEPCTADRHATAETKRDSRLLCSAPARTAPADFSVSTIADAIGCSSGKEEQRAHLLNYLKNRSLFLILDNFEHLLDEVGFLSQMLAAAPDLQVLVTSREVLNLREEWLYPVQGLDYPRGGDDEGDRQDAVRLFLTWAQRVQPGFSLADNRASRFVSASWWRVCHWQLNWRLPGFAHCPVRPLQPRSNGTWIFYRRQYETFPNTTAAYGLSFNSRGYCLASKNRQFSNNCPSSTVGLSETPHNRSLTLLCPCSRRWLINRC